MKNLIKKFHNSSADLRQFVKVLDEAMRDEPKTSEGRKLTNKIMFFMEKFLSERERMVEKCEVAGKLRDFRLSQKMSQDELAAKIGVGRRQLIRWEQGTTKPHYHFLRKLEELGVK